MIQIPARPLILDEFLKLPETEPAREYIDDQIIQKPMPQVFLWDIIPRQEQGAIANVFSTETLEHVREVAIAAWGRSRPPQQGVCEGTG
jgi:hypothetical protein